ncbi:hypothetical protein EWM64_g3905 [Hericium alpestre]|uniref:Enoyl reductase (ER) domain-containing protein n=1 Tax=Hericium alpestre TaxID=135208 RepID=A0A4Z0A334_9AGAM|nr:hypothetical protein EWM64_g3905 [Hericium alpestre]
MSTQYTIPETHLAVIIQPNKTVAVERVPVVHPGPGEVLIKVSTAGQNPADWKVIQFDVSPPGKGIGSDLVGTVVELGAGVEDVALGERVGTVLVARLHESSAFREYVVVPSKPLIRIPDNVSDEVAAVVPSGAYSAAYGLHTLLGFPLNAPFNRSILVWGGSASVGWYTIQLAKLTGWKVIATARPRSMAKLDDLKQLGAETLELEVTAPLDELHAVAKTAVAIYGHVDVLVNNAGFFVGGAIEEFTPQETYDQFNTNLFGPLNVARAFLPYMRARRAGMVAWVGSLASWVPIVNLGVYGSTKIAMRLFSMTLNDDITPFGLRSILFEPGYFRTPFIAPGRSDVSTNRINDYREMCGRAEAALQAVDGNQLGDPEKGAQVMVDFIRGEGQAAGKNVPTVIHLGSDTVRDAARVCNETLQRIDEWKDVFVSTDFPEGV